MADRKTEAYWVESQGRWQCKVQKDGERKTFYSSAPGKKGKIEAERKADAWLNVGSTKDMRLQALWDDFLSEIKETTGTCNYKDHELQGRKWLLPNLKHKKVSNITMQDWQDCINAAHKEGLSRKSLQHIRGSVTALYGYARKRRINMERPEFLTIPKAAPTGKRKILQPDELKLLFEIDSINFKGKPKLCYFIHAFRFMVLTGIRRGELCGLKKTDIQDGILYISRSINKFDEVTGGKTENAQRYIMLHKRALKVLEDQNAMLKDKYILSPWLFPNETGGRLDSPHFYREWAKYRDQHDLKCSLHELRHTMISIVQNDVPDPLLKAMVGHSKTMDTHGIYGHEVDGDAERCSSIIDDVFNRVLK